MAGEAAGGDRAPIFLPEVLDLQAAKPLHASLSAARGRAVTLDASEVQRLGGQCLQILLAAKTAWAADGLAFAVQSPSPAFTGALALLGVADAPAFGQESFQ